MVDRVLKFFNSLKLTVALLCAGLVLVFFGTLAQEPMGLYEAQARFFKVFFVDHAAMAAGLWKATHFLSMRLPPPGHDFLFGDARFPVFPGGYLIGTVLLINLVVAHLKRFQSTKKKIGIHLIHGGVVLLLLGQLLTDAFSSESAMRLAEGESKNYSQDFRANELVVIDTSNPQHDEVVAIPEERVAKKKEIRHEKLPVTLRIHQYWQNSWLLEQPTNSSVPLSVTQGLGKGLHLLPLKAAVSMEERNVPSAIVEVVAPQGSLGTWLVSSQSSAQQEFSFQNKTYQLSMRFTRHYKPFHLKLLEFTHEKYRGTEIPRNFASRVRIQRPETREDREVLIYMNNPLRYNGETYYQAGFDENNDQLVNKVTILQVVRNPSWLTPYFSCVLVALGMIVQFVMHLVGFVMKRRSA
jgi:ResB-like family